MNLFARFSRKTSKARLIVFTRYPTAGVTKTRLIPALGETGAASLHREMTAHTLSTARRYQAQNDVAFEVCFDGGSRYAMRRLYGDDIDYCRQCQGDLGERMMDSFQRSFSSGSEKVMIIGTDCPELSTEDIEQSFSLLDNNDLVVGPAHDGGYYLIGLSSNNWKKAISGVFRNISWGTNTVLQETLNAADTLELSHQLLRILHDVDRPADLVFWERVRNKINNDQQQLKISVVIPTMNESGVIAETLSCLENGKNVEIIIVDGGSTDTTIEIVNSHKIKVITSPPGRACQMNAGAQEAAGDLLMFLHADTKVPTGYDKIIRGTLDDTSVACGAFSFRTDSRMKSLRFIEKTTNWRAREMGMPYGDQALFMRKDVFASNGGFPDQPLMEDFEFVRRLKKKGKIVIVPEYVVTSGRRWENRGFWRVTLLNQSIIAAYLLGVSPVRLHRWYYGRK